MKTLLERAKPELLAGMELEGAKHSALVEYTKKWLSENYFCNLITWSTWVDLRSYWLTATGKLLDNPWEVFED
jgi:hypothetical protein